MVKEMIVALVAGLVIFEIVEHLVFPMVWSILQRKKGSACDISSMVGKVVEVKQWENLAGIVFFDGALWTARSDARLFIGDRAVIEELEGLVLIVKKFPAISHFENKV